MTDRELIKAEIVKLIKHSETVADHNSQMTELVSRELDSLYHLIHLINSLSEEPVIYDLEEAADSFAEKAYPYIGGVKGMICESSKPIFKKGFKAGDHWLRKKIKRVVDKIDVNNPDYEDLNDLYDFCCEITKNI